MALSVSAIMTVSVTVTTSATVVVMMAVTVASNKGGVQWNRTWQPWSEVDAEVI